MSEEERLKKCLGEDSKPEETIKAENSLIAAIALTMMIYQCDTSKAIDILLDFLKGKQHDAGAETVQA